MNRRSVGLLAAMSLLLTLAVGCSDTEYHSERSGSQPRTSCLEILSHSRRTTEYGNVTVVGTAKNVSGKNLSYAEIRVKFKDASGTLLDTSLDNINDLGPGEVWRYEVWYFGDTPFSRYEIGVGSCF